MEQIKKAEKSALSTLKILLKHLPYNRNRVYLEVDLHNSRCKLYLPLRDVQIKEAKKIKENLQAVIDLAQL
jgi:hypothetical protein